MRGVLMALAALVVASAAGGATPRITSGLRGVVTKGPTSPVCREGESCEAPAVGLVLRFARNGRVVARTETREGGAYRVRLRPGRYVVTTTPGRAGTGLTPRVVRVRADTFRRVDFFLDTGIQ